MHCTIFHPLKNVRSFRKEFWFLNVLCQLWLRWSRFVRRTAQAHAWKEPRVTNFFVYSRVTVEFLLSYNFYESIFLGELFYISLQLIRERRSLVNTNVTDERQRQKCYVIHVQLFSLFVSPSSFLLFAIIVHAIAVPC